MSPAVDYERLAAYYDALISVDEDVPFFRDICLTSDGPVIELMAGTGRVSIPLLEAGVDLACVDSSPAMLAILQGKIEAAGLEAPLFLQDVTELDLPTTYALAFIAFHSFAELTTEDQQRRALRSIHRSLGPGGRFLCTLHNPRVRLESIGVGPCEAMRALAPDGVSELVLTLDVEWDATRAVAHGVEALTRHSQDGSVEELERLPIQFALLDPSAFERLTHASGLEVVDLYGGWDRSPYDPTASGSMVWVLERPA